MNGRTAPPFGPRRISPTSLNTIQLKRERTTTVKPTRGIDGIVRPKLQPSVRLAKSNERRLDKPAIVSTADPAANVSSQEASKVVTKKRPSRRNGRILRFSRSEALVFTAGMLFATGFIAIGFYMGISRPGVLAENATTAEHVEITDEHGNKSIVVVETDPGIDTEEVDINPPKPITPDMPARLRMPRLGINAPVRSLGLTRSGDLAAPNYTSQVGWFDQSLKPGSGGTVVMDGHYGIPAGKAVFGRFGELEHGDVFEVETGDGQVYQYAVDEIEIYPNGQVPMDKLIASDGVERLNLITCSGGWDGSQGTYDSRTIVYAVRI